MKLRADHHVVVGLATKSPPERLKRVRDLVTQLVQLAA